MVIYFMAFLLQQLDGLRQGPKFKAEGNTGVEALRGYTPHAPGREEGWWEQEKVR